MEDTLKSKRDEAFNAYDFRWARERGLHRATKNGVRQSYFNEGFLVALQLANKMTKKELKEALNDTK